MSRNLNYLLIEGLSLLSFQGLKRRDERAANPQNSDPIGDRPKMSNRSKASIFDNDSIKSPKKNDQKSNKISDFQRTKSDNSL